MTLITWAIDLSPADTGLTLEVQPLTNNGNALGPPLTSLITELGNGVYGFWADVNPSASFLVARAAGGGVPLRVRALTPVDLLLVNSDGTVLASVSGDIEGNLLGSVAGVIQGDPYFAPEAPYTFAGPGMGDMQGRVLGDTSFWDAQGVPIPPFVGPGVHLDPDDPALPTGGGGGDPATIAAAVWDRLTSLLTTPGSIGAFLLAKLAGFGTGSVVMQSALSSDGGVMRVIAGDSYEVSGSARPFVWVDTTDALAGYTIASAVWLSNTALASKAVTATTVNGHLAYQLELTHAETATMAPRNDPPYDFALVLTLSDGDEVTWKRGDLRVKARV